MVTFCIPEIFVACDQPLEIYKPLAPKEEKGSRQSGRALEGDGQGHCDVLMISGVHIYLQSHRVVYIKYLYLPVCQP